LKILKKIKSYLELVKFEHSIFAVPFAISSIFTVEKGIPPLEKIFWILIALIAGRTAGMAFNRLIDLPFDKLNPRSKNWASVSGLVKPFEILFIAIFSSLVLIFAAYQLNKLAFYLSPVAIILFIIYPLGKRFTYLVHLILGLIYFIIPIAVEIALKETVSLSSIFLGLAMAFWVSGFDILYALQDIEFDKKVGLYSIPSKFGIRKAILIARFFHFLTLIFLILTGIYAKMGIIYFVGLFILTLFLIYEHSLIKENDLSKINVAFFTVNGYVSIVYMLIVILDVFISKIRIW